MASTTLDIGILFHVCFPNKINTQVTIINGTIVSNVFTILKIVRALPSKDLSTLSRAKITNDDAPCSNDIQKNIVKNANIITAIIR